MNIEISSYFLKNGLGYLNFGYINLLTKTPKFWKARINDGISILERIYQIFMAEFGVFSCSEVCNSEINLTLKGEGKTTVDR